MRRLVAVAALAGLLVGGCRVRPCREGTVLLTIKLPNSIADADRFEISATVGTSSLAAHATHPRGQGEGSLELTFPGGYPTGQTAQLDVTALRDGALVGRAHGTVALGDGCASFTIVLGDQTVDDAGMPLDLTLVDLTGADLAGGDLAGADLTSPGDMAMLDLYGVDMTACGAVSAAATHYVDPVNGKNLPTYGGLPGGCAYKTIGYALTQASGLIVLAKTSYTTATGETFPLIMSGTQEIDCNQGTTGFAGAATINGSGSYAGMAAFPAIGMQGSQNTVRNCNIGPIPNASTGVAVNSVAGGTGHLITNSQIQAGLHGIDVLSAGGNVKIVQNVINNCATAIGWYSAGPGVMTNNSVPASGTPGIGCTSTAATVTGSGNNSGGLAISCSGCQNCPFGP